MEFALTQEVSEHIIKNKVSDYITQMSNYVSDFLEHRDYGDNLKTVYVRIICVSPEFDFFFKMRKPKYKKGTVVTIEDGRPYEQTDAVTYDLKLNYTKYVDSSENEVKTMLSTELLNSFAILDNLKIKHFDRVGFERDVGGFLKLHLIE